MGYLGHGLRVMAVSQSPSAFKHPARPAASVRALIEAGTA